MKLGKISCTHSIFYDSWKLPFQNVRKLLRWKQTKTAQKHKQHRQVVDLPSCVCVCLHGSHWSEIGFAKTVDCQNPVAVSKIQIQTNATTVTIKYHKIYFSYEVSPYSQSDTAIFVCIKFLWISMYKIQSTSQLTYLHQLIPPPVYRLFYVTTLLTMTSAPGASDSNCIWQPHFGCTKHLE